MLTVFFPDVITITNNIVPTEVDGGAADKGYRAVIQISKISANFYQFELVRLYNVSTTIQC